MAFPDRSSSSPTAAPTPVTPLSSVRLAPQATPASSSFVRTNPITRPFASAYDYIDSWRKNLDLPNPGTAEAIGSQAKNVQAINYMFDGFKGEAIKVINLQNPYFSVQHSFSMGSQISGPGGAPAGVHPGTYAFAAQYAGPRSLLTAHLDNTGQLQGRANWAWSSTDVSKFQVGVSSQTIAHFEHDHLGSDYTLSLKAMNPSPSDLTGIYQFTYLQSLTPRFSLGADLILQRPHPLLTESAISYLAKLTGGNSAAHNEWVATAQTLPNGALQANYYQRLSDRVDAQAEVSLNLAEKPSQRGANANVGVRWEMRATSFRTMVDSKGKLMAYMDQKILPTLGVLFSAEVDHWKNTSKFGVGVSFETPPDEAQLLAAQEAQEAAAKAGQAQGPNPLLM